jgi:hypothetical protein
MKKDFQRGTARLAEGASLLQEGNSVSDHSHVSKMTPLDTKKKEIAEGLQYDAIDKGREKSTSQRRLDKDVRPL